MKATSRVIAGHLESYVSLLAFELVVPFFADLGTDMLCSRPFKSNDMFNTVGWVHKRLL